MVEAEERQQIPALDWGRGEQGSIVCNGLLGDMLLAGESFVINSTWDEKCCVYENVILPV